MKALSVLWPDPHRDDDKDVITDNSRTSTQSSHVKITVFVSNTHTGTQDLIWLILDCAGVDNLHLFFIICAVHSYEYEMATRVWIKTSGT